jgi:hypothetical protein
VLTFWYFIIARWAYCKLRSSIGVPLSERPCLRPQLKAFPPYSYLIRSRDNTIGIATWPGFDSPTDAGDYSLLHSLQTQPPIQWVPESFYPWVKRQGHEAEHSPSSNAIIKNGGTITPDHINLHCVMLN